jgi:hypothetical protein
MRFTSYRNKVKHKSKSYRNIPGTIEIKYKDENGNPIFEWKRNRSGNNVEAGIYEMMRFFQEKMSIDIVNYLKYLETSSNQNINIQKETIGMYTKKEGDTANGNNTK